MADNSDIFAKVKAFLAGQFSLKEGRQCVKLTMFHSNVGFRDDQIREWVKADDPDLFDNLNRIEELTNEIIEISEGHADSFGSGSHRYLLKTIQHLGGRAQESWKVSPSYSAGSELTVPGSLSSNGNPNIEAMAIVSQNNQMLMRTNQQLTTTAFGTLAGFTDDLRSRCATLEADNTRLRKELTEATSNQLEREFEISMRMEKNKRTNATVDQALQIASVVATKMAGGEPGSMGTSPFGQLVLKFGTSLRADQRNALFNVLDVGQKVMFMEIMNQVLPKETPEPATNGAAAPAQVTSGATSG